MSRVLKTFAAFLVLCVAAQAALAANIVYLVRVGTDAEGNPQFRAADSRDTYLAGLFEMTNNSRAMHEVARYYEQVQREKLAASLAGRGLSAQDIEYAKQNFQADPVFIEVNNSRAGAYNDWKGRFSVQWGNGQAATYSTPRVVFSLGSDVARSGNRALIEQTLVHEVGHGAMCKCHGANNLPQTPWLSKPHSGGSVTDEQLAFIEGWAEFIGSYFTGRRTIAEDPANAIDSNWYARRADGSMKSAQDLVRTEGWNATILYKIATEARDQNAMWKMTQVMTRTSPQSTMQMLQQVGQYFPELAPTINRVVARESGNQIPYVVAGGQYANNGYTGNNGGYTSNYGPGVDRLEQALYGGGSGAYTGYQNYANYQRQTYGGGGQGSSGQVWQDTNQLMSLYQQKRAQLDAVPWWKFWEKSKIKEELSMIEDLYSRQAQLAQGYGYAAAPSAPAQGQQMQQVAPAAPVTSKKTYTDAVGALKSNDSAAAAASLDAHRRAFESRKAARQGGPGGER